MDDARLRALVVRLRRRGAAAAGGYRELSDNLHYAGYLFVGAIVLFAVLVLAVKKILNAAEARHLDE